MILLLATPPALPVRIVRQTQCSFSRPRLQLYRSGLSDTLSVPSLGHASSFTGQDCQTHSVFLLSATPPALPVRTVRRSVPSLGHASSFTGQDCQTQCSFSRPRLQLYRSGLSDAVFLLSATPPALPVRTVRRSVPSLGHASSFTGQDCQTQCSFSRPRLQLYRSGLSDAVLLFSVTPPTAGQDCFLLFFSSLLCHASRFTGQDCQI